MQLLKQPKKQKLTKAMDLVRHDVISIENFLVFPNLFKFFGFDFRPLFWSVPSENKRDMRTIEDVQADIQAKKKMKLSQTVTSDGQHPSTE